MAKNELLSPRDDSRKRDDRTDVSVFGGLKGIIRLEKALREGEGAAEAIKAGKMGLGKKGSFANWLKAQDLSASGKTSDEVWNETGWFQHPVDKGWRMEIPDTNAKFDFDKFVKLTDPKVRNAPYQNYLQNKAQFYRDKLKELKITVAKDDDFRKDFMNVEDRMIDEVAKGDWEKIRQIRAEANAKFGALNPDPVNPTLDQILDHPEMFKMYPELRGIKVERENNPLYRGSYNEESDTLSLKPAAEYSEPGSGPLSTSLHESQHGIQSIEDAERGINPGAVSQEFIGQMEQFFDKASPAQLGDDEFLRAMMEFADDPKMMGYRRSIGEAEARNVQTRLKILQTMGSPTELSPLETMDVPAYAQYRLNELLAGFANEGK